MQTGQITQTYGIRRDTLRFYIKKGLLTPQLVNGHYDWSEEDCKDLENILALRQLGLSIKAITRIKYLHDHHCSSSLQLTENRQVILHEIADRKAQIRKLEEQIKNMEDLIGQIDERLAEPKKLR